MSESTPLPRSPSAPSSALLSSVYDQVVLASSRIYPVCLVTPLEESHYLSSLVGGGAQVALKLDFLQPSGSFKLRGACNKLTAMISENPATRSCVTASTGNHALAVAHVSRLLKCSAKIVIPETTKKTKIRSLSYFSNVECIFKGTDCLESEMHAKKLSETLGLTFVSPYNDLAVMAGQGTAAVEIMQQVQKSPLGGADVIIISVGGGGLIGGMAAYVKMVAPHVQIWGVQPKASKVMYESVLAGKILDLPSEETLSDATAGGIEEGSITFPVVQACVDRWILLEEEEIAESIALMVHFHQYIVEGAAADTVAALIKEKESLKGKRVVLFLCGRKINSETVADVLKKYPCPK